MSVYKASNTSEELSVDLDVDRHKENLREGKLSL